ESAAGRHRGDQPRGPGLRADRQQGGERGVADARPGRPEDGRAGRGATAVLLRRDREARPEEPGPGREAARTAAEVRGELRAPGGECWLVTPEGLYSRAQGRDATRAHPGETNAHRMREGSQGALP